MKRLRWYWTWLWGSHMFWLGPYLVFFLPSAYIHWQREPYGKEGPPHEINWLRQMPKEKP